MALRFGAAGGAAEQSLDFEAGSTLFCSMKLALKLAQPDLLRRARRLTCVYRRGFGKVVEGVYPLIAPSLAVL